MSRQLIYTSASRGLKPGSSGFCTVAADGGMSQALMTKLELLSGYEFRYSLSDPNAERNPVNFCHTRISLGGQTSSVLSRVAFSGADYSGRTNKIAHHFLLEEGELLPPGPAWMIREMARTGHFRTSWNDPPKVVGSLPLPDVLPEQPSGQQPLQGWGRLGDPGWAGLIARAFCRNKKVPAYFIFEPGMDLLVLFEESLRLLPPNMRWGVCFATYYTAAPPDCHYHWRGVLAGSSAAREMARFPGAAVIDLTKRLGSIPPGDEDEFVKAAREGRVVPKLLPAPVSRPAARVAEVAGVPIPLGSDDDEEDPRRRAWDSAMNDLASAARTAPRSAAPPPHFVMVEKRPGWTKWALMALSALVCALLVSNAVTLWLLHAARSQPPMPGVVPIAAGGLTAKAISSTQIDLSWPGLAEHATGISLERSEDGTGAWKKIDIGKADKGHQDSGLSPGKMYKYRLVAPTNTEGIAYLSEAVATTLSLPAAPTDLTAEATSPTQIDLKWSWPGTRKDGMHFQIERKKASSQDWEKVTECAALDYADKGLSPGTVYAYRVFASDTAGHSKHSDEVSATTPPPSAAPATQAETSTAGPVGQAQPAPRRPDYTKCRLSPSGAGAASPVAKRAFPEQDWGKDLQMKVSVPLDIAADERWELRDLPGHVVQQSIHSYARGDGHAVLGVRGLSRQVLVTGVLKRRDDGKEMVLECTADKVAWNDPKLRLLARFLVVRVRARNADKTVQFAMRPEKPQRYAARCGWIEGKSIVLLEPWRVDVDYPWPKSLHGRPGKPEAEQGFDPITVELDGRKVSLQVKVQEQLERKPHITFSCKEFDEWLKRCKTDLDDAKRKIKEAKERRDRLKKQPDKAGSQDKQKEIGKDKEEVQQLSVRIGDLLQKVKDASHGLKKLGPIVIYDPWDLPVAKVTIELVPPAELGG